jgi:ribonuclease Z
MVWVVRVALGLIALFFVVGGLCFVLTPEAMAAEFFITPLGVAGLSTVRADLGGAFIAVGSFIGLGLRPGATQWLYAAAIATGSIAIARIIALVADGVDEHSVAACVVEVVFLALLVIGARRLQRA